MVRQEWGIGHWISVGVDFREVYRFCEMLSPQGAQRGTGVTLGSYSCAIHLEAIFNHSSSRETSCMTGDSTKRKDTLKVEKVSLLLLTLCIVVLVYVLVARPF